MLGRADIGEKTLRSTEVAGLAFAALRSVYNTVAGRRLIRNLGLTLRSGHAVPFRKELDSNVATVGPDQLAIPPDARVLKQYESEIMRDICNGGSKSETRTIFRHVPNSAANGLRVFNRDYFGGAMHRVSRAFSVFRWAWNHRSVHITGQIMRPIG